MTMQLPTSPPGPIRAVWELRREQLAFMETRERNAVFRDAFRGAIESWRQAFVPLRFTKYVQRQPFPLRYQAPVAKALAALGLTRRGNPAPGVGRHGRLFRAARAVIDGDLHGWNPWTSAPPPVALVLAWRKAYPGVAKGTAILPYVRAWAKRHAAQRFKALQMHPLVLTGDLRAGAMGGRSRATATNNKLTGFATVPSPGKRNPVVGRTIRTVPQNEVDHVARVFERGILAAVTGRTSSLADRPRQRASPAAIAERAA